MSIPSSTTTRVWLLLSFLAGVCQGWQTPRHGATPHRDRRRFLISVSSILASAAVQPQLLPNNDDAQAVAATGTNLQFQTSASGIQWADARIGSGSPKRVGDVTAVDYVLSTTGARYGSKIYSTQGDVNNAVAASSSNGNAGFATGAPYRRTLGDGSTIAGLEQAILGDSTGMSAMLPGGVRRVIIPSNLAYASLKESDANCQIGIGPVPPPSTAFEQFQRFRNIYCNPDRVYQPDVVIDIKLYGCRQ